MKAVLSLAFLCAIFLSPSALASDRTGQARLFLGSTVVSPSELNASLDSQGMRTINLNNQFGLEINFPLGDYFHYGLRYSRRIVSQDEASSNPSTDYKTDMTQDVAAGVFRLSFLRNDYLRMDAVVGIGGSNTDAKIKTASQDGELKKSGSPFGTLYSMAGLSLGVGKGKYFFLIEAGYEQQKVDGFKRTGTIDSSIQNINLSGEYFTIGFMFDGIPIFTK
jgi:hypothetical protein